MFSNELKIIEVKKKEEEKYLKQEKDAKRRCLERSERHL